MMGYSPSLEMLVPRPLEIEFLLHDGRLQLSRIVKNIVKDAEIAFLSVYRTSTGDEKTSGEAVHLDAPSGGICSILDS